MSKRGETMAMLDPERTGLLVVDMQNAFVHPQGTLGASGVDIAPARRMIPQVRRLVMRCRSAGLAVVWTQQIHLEGDAARERRRLPEHTSRRRGLAARAGTWDAEIVDELSDLADDPTFIVRKHRFGAFYATRLDGLLRALGVEALLVCGTTANACIDTTLREAYMRDLDLVAVTDCIASIRPEWTDVTHAIWRQYLAVLADSEHVLAWLAGPGGRERPRDVPGTTDPRSAAP